MGENSFFLRQLKKTEIEWGVGGLCDGKTDCHRVGTNYIGI